MPTFIGAIIVGAVRVLVAVVAIFAVAGCGRGRQAWPDCLHVAGATHVRIASRHDLAQTPKQAEAARAASVDLANGSEAILVASRTSSAAGRVARFFRTIGHLFNGLPGPAPPAPPSHVLQNGRVVLQWFGKRDRKREQALLACATR